MVTTEKTTDFPVFSRIRPYWMQMFFRQNPASENIGQARIGGYCEALSYRSCHHQRSLSSVRPHPLPWALQLSSSPASRARRWILRSAEGAPYTSPGRTEPRRALLPVGEGSPGLRHRKESERWRRDLSQAQSQRRSSVCGSASIIGRAFSARTSIAPATQGYLSRRAKSRPPGPSALGWY